MATHAAADLRRAAALAGEAARSLGVPAAAPGGIPVAA
jgi:hypothetical protein